MARKPAKAEPEQAAPGSLKVAQAAALIRVSVRRVQQLVQEGWIKRDPLTVVSVVHGYANWLEEEIDAGRVPLPGGVEQYVASRTGIANAEWRGSPKPQADDLKAAKAYEVLRNGMGCISDTMIAQEYGRDIEDVYHELADERKLRKRLGLPETFSPGQKAEERRIKEEGIPDEPAPAEDQ